MTALHLSDPPRARPVAPRVSVMLGAGLLGGCLLGVFARAWMRLISETPGFTWNGTLFIVIGFTVFGGVQAVAWLAWRRCVRSWSWAIARVVGTLGVAPLLLGAGVLMLPTIVGGGFAMARSDWPKWLRIVCLAVALGPVAFFTKDLVETFGWSARSLVGTVLMLALYGTIVRAARPTFSRRPSPAETGHQEPVRSATATFLARVGEHARSAQ